MSSTVVADSDGVFTTSSGVTGDPVETEYVVEAIAAQGEAEETTTSRFQRSARP